MHKMRAILLGSVAIGIFSNPLSAAAQTTIAPPEQVQVAVFDSDIIVTARRRTETSLAAPVVVTGLTRQQLEIRGIRSLEGFARTVPSLIIGEAAGATQGGPVSLRGISASDSNPFGDQAVAFNIDGVQIARSSVRRMSELDLAQIEVLKGPQALYFGKNSPGGIVVMRTADPSDHVEAGATAGYELNAHEWRGEGYISVPLASGLGVRVAGYGSRMCGWISNVATSHPTLGPRNDTLPGAREFGGRLTLKYDDGGPFTARFKLAHADWRNRGASATAQRVYCPYGQPHYGTGTVNGVLSPIEFGGPDTCKADDEVVQSDIGTAFNQKWPLFGDGVPESSQTQTLGGLELNYALSPDLKLTSQTGYYRNRYHKLDMLSGADTSFPNRIYGSDSYLTIREWSNELRLTSSFDGPINFVVGAYYQDSRLFNAQESLFNVNNPTYASPLNASRLKGEAWSAFASISFKPFPTLELSGGGRYSHEAKDYAAFCLLTGTGPCTGRTATGQPIADIHSGSLFDPSLPGGTAVSHRSFSDFSPEATIAWRPTDRLTLFGNYKTGFLSGGFQTGSGNMALDQSYDQQKVKGFEGGVKALLFDRTLRVNLAAYHYKITGQQVGITVGAANFLRNAASSRTKGGEFDFNWTTPVDGFSLRGGVSYNKAAYSSFPGAPCYAGQTIAMGCTIVNGSPQQDLSGKPIVRSPKWGAFLGGTMEMPLGETMRLGFTSDANYTSGYFAEATDKPGSWQQGDWLLDASAYLRRGPFEFAVIGRNLTNTYYFQRTIDAIFSGGGTGTANGVLADTFGSVSRGREIWFQVKYKM